MQVQICDRPRPECDCYRCRLARLEMQLQSLAAATARMRKAQQKYNCSFLSRHYEAALAAEEAVDRLLEEYGAHEVASASDEG